MVIFYHMKVPIKIAYASTSFGSLAEYEEYRKKILNDQKCLEAFKLAEENKFILSYERSFTSPGFK